MDVHLVYSLAFGIFSFLFYYFVWPKIRDHIDRYIQEIHEKIEGATLFRENAVSFLNDCKKKSQEASEKSARIIENAHLEAQQLELNAQKEIALFEKQQKELTADKLFRVELSIIQKIRMKITEETMKKVYEKLRENNHDSCH